MNIKINILKKTLLIAIASILSINTSAQIAEEINSMVDSTKITINNGRRLLLKSLNENNPQKASQVYYYLLTAVDDENCVAFEFHEQLLIASLTSDWHKWLELAENISEYKKNAACYFQIYQIDQSLYDLLKEKVEALILEEKGLPEEGVYILNLYLYMVKNEKADEEYNEKLKLFKKSYPQSKYLNFVNNYLPGPGIKGAFAFSLGTSQTFQTNNLGEMFSPGTMAQLSLDFNINRTYISFYLSGGNLRLKSPFDASFNNIDTTFNTNESFVYTEYGLKGGYFILRSPRFHFAPYASISGNSLKSNIYDSDEKKEDDELKIINSFLCGIGLHTELKLFEFTTNRNYYGYPMKNYISLKVDLGYNYIAKHNYDIFKGDMFYFRPTLVWGMGDF